MLIDAINISGQGFIFNRKIYATEDLQKDQIRPDCHLISDNVAGKITYAVSIVAEDLRCIRIDRQFFANIETTTRVVKKRMPK